MFGMPYVPGAPRSRYDNCGQSADDDGDHNEPMLMRKRRKISIYIYILLFSFILRLLEQ